MKLKIMGVFLMTLLLASQLVLSNEDNGEISLSITSLNGEITAIPGDTIVVPFSIKNIGNTTVGNLTVYLTGPVKGFQYSGKTLRILLRPGESYNDTLILKILNAEPGRYLLKLVVRVGSYRFEAPLIVRVKPLVDYSLSIAVNDRYIYGHPVEVRLEVKSKSNTILTGRIGYCIIGRKTIVNESIVTFVKPGSSWIKMLRFNNLPPGNYTVVLWANLSRLYKKASVSFEVYQRALSYSVRFENGAIRVFVYDKTGRGVPDIPVSINGIWLKTGLDGTVLYSVSSPGRYKVVLNLDGRIVSTEVEVKGLSISSIQEGNRLIVQVTDGKNPVPNVTVTVIGPEGRDFGITNRSGFVEFNASKIGYGTVVIRGESSQYLPAEVIVTLTRPPEPPKTSTQNITATFSRSEGNISASEEISSTEKPRSWISMGTALLLIISGIIFAGSSYVAFAMPIIQEETLDKYYFLKVKAPKLRPLKNYRIERPVKAVEIRTTKGRARLENGKLIWELDLEPGEEAYLQAVLG